MANIYTKAEVEHSKTNEKTDIYTIRFSGAVMEVEHVKPSQELIELFKKGVLAERERIWDVAAELNIDDETLRKLLKHNSETK